MQSKLSWPSNKGCLCKPSEKMFAIFSSITGLSSLEESRSCSMSAVSQLTFQWGLCLMRHSFPKKGTCNRSLSILSVHLYWIDPELLDNWITFVCMSSYSLYEWRWTFLLFCMCDDRLLFLFQLVINRLKWLVYHQNNNDFIHFLNY